MQPQPDAAAEHELALGEAPHRTERVTKAPSMSEEDYVEAGAKELQQLYADMAPDMCRLLSQQRLVLVLDLDHTLVNSARQTEIDPEHVLVLTDLILKPCAGKLSSLGCLYRRCACPCIKQ